ncbi:cobyrinic acid a,c-diamide synthase [Dulcicalothrix desertica PCC 7102]|uniref:Cobyrinate a,c-diamide synthase n=1 Tax=Dulcicalothrix desertica PCC 7102 TaxID=232991 RepID=A0A3S1B7P5_9CYAN|nr:cobyrinate a,c-diamide synthase [Dulcicalothrix desertica]RUT06518.1 cobyrinic acid a,c-diamide synthase [Dulcicalothrix desertica PCC 7102]TWH50367.1 cobyrinic acid a,c-diamide synthase [Dulcicalothrix desertica PCC 7102]
MSLIIAGERSGVGKTTVTLALLAYLCKNNYQVQSYKVGPDYIDPMFHRYITGKPSRNLDPVLTSETYVKECYHHHRQQVDIALIEGVMGLFDGIGNKTIPFASTAHIAKLLNIPVILVVDCSRLSGSVAAIVHGYSTLDPTINIAGVVLNRVGSDRHLDLLKNALLPLQIKILGVLRREDNISIPDRHLGLVPTSELSELDAIISRLADLGANCFDWQTLLPLLGDTGNGKRESVEDKYTVRIAVALDNAFNFYYQDNLDLLQKFGAELVFWSPIKDNLPKHIQGMYFGGGFPEVFAQELSNNIGAIKSVKAAINTGMPTIAECGGLMYLCEKIIDFEGKACPMVGALPTQAVMDKRLTLGYRRAVTLHKNFLFDTNTVIYGHEFHRSHLLCNSKAPTFETYRVDTEEPTGLEGWSTQFNVHASYIHQHWGSSPEIPQRFLKYCADFSQTPNSLT